MDDHDKNFQDVERIRLRLGMSGAALCREMELPTNKYSKWRNGSEQCRKMHAQAANWILQQRSGLNYRPDAGLGSDGAAA